MTDDSLTLLDNRMAFAELPKLKLTQLLINTWKGKKIYFSTDDDGDVFENWMKSALRSNDFRSF
ncbi:MAG: hypothetical protein II005_00915, partial [Turicibacter sp.]|nr:hypothetical protein [Turicibacter sp.]